MSIAIEEPKEPKTDKPFIVDQLYEALRLVIYEGVDERSSEAMEALARFEREYGKDANRGSQRTGI